MSLLTVFLFLAVCLLAYANGSNDNFKGVATLFGSRTTNYRGAIAWATVTTLAGSVASIFLAQELGKKFSGRGIVRPEIAGAPDFLLAVALGAGLAVLLATLTGFPISTTHSLIGALAGGGLAAVGAHVDFVALGKSFFLPLLLSPLIATCLGGGTYALFLRLRVPLGLTQKWCLCLGQTDQATPANQPASSPLPGCAMMPEVDVNAEKGHAQALTSTAMPDVSLDTQESCAQRYHGRILRLNSRRLLDIAHFLSAGVVSFARGLNDTPKIVALLIGVRALGIRGGMIAVAAGMAVGGIISARKVAGTMSNKITSMTHGQGFTANLVTGALVIFASRLGMPVSTTHVSTGSLFGLGLITGKANVKVISEILLSWVLTLPIAAVLSAIVYWMLNNL